MSKKLTRIFVLSSILCFSFSLFQVPVLLASSNKGGKVEVEITVKVNQKGFLDAKGKLYNKKNPLKVAKGKVVRINFVFAENMTSLAYGDTHQVAIASQEGWNEESEKFWMFSQKASVVFTSGKEGARYRAYCILDCIGMDNLNNLIIQVV